MQSVNDVVDEIISLYKNYGSDDYIGEPVSQIEHMCQCAQLAENEGYDEEVILAAFFHDIGHLCEHIMPVQQMNGYGVTDMKTGCRLFAQQRIFFDLASLVENHVQAKRYLTYHYTDYYKQLSGQVSKHWNP
jgi:predicted HD phosphohydrolase